MQGSVKVRKIFRRDRGGDSLSPAAEEKKKQKIKRLRREAKVVRRKERQRVIRESRRDPV